MSSPVTIQHNLNRLNTAIRLYVQARKWTAADALERNSYKLGIALATEAKGLAPKKGAITSERLDAFAVGQGIRIRQSVMKRIADKYQIAPMGGPALFKRRGGKGKYRGSVMVKGVRMNLQAIAVKAELALRESGRGFLSLAERLAVMSKGKAYTVNRIERSVSKYGPQLGNFGLTVDKDGNGQAVFKWGGFSQLSDDAVKAMGRPRGMAAVNRAIAATVDDMIPYLERKLGEDAVKILK